MNNPDSYGCDSCLCLCITNNHRRMAIKYVREEKIKSHLETRLTWTTSCTSILLILLATVCSIKCEKSIPKMAIQGHGINRQASDFRSDQLYFLQNEHRSGNLYVRHKRDVIPNVSSSQGDTLTCNNIEEQTPWTCVCHGCDDGVNDTTECCLDTLRDDLVSESVTILLNNITYSHFTADLEADIKAAVAKSLSDYCGDYLPECSSTMGTGDNVNTSPMTPTEGIIISPVRFLAHHVIISKLSSQHHNSSDSNMPQVGVSLFVLDTHTREQDGITGTSLPLAVPAHLLLSALQNRTKDLEAIIGYAVVSVNFYAWIETQEQARVLPIRYIVAASILGFMLVLSCIVSAVKAVRDRRLIKERNAAKREKKRHQELKDSLRRSPLKQKLAEYAENGDVRATSSNGHVRSPSLSSQVIQVVIHTDLESANGNLHQNSDDPVCRDDARHTITTYGEVHVPPNETVNGSVKRPNGVSMDDTTEDLSKFSAGHLSASDAFLPRTVDMVEADMPPHYDDVCDTSPPPAESSKMNNGSSMENPNYMKSVSPNGGSPRSSDTAVDDGNVTPAPRPGLVNPAYDGE